MSVALAERVRGFIVPQERMTVEIERLGKALYEVNTIPDVKKVIVLAEAVAMATKSLNASERLRREAGALVVRAERRLGEITMQLEPRPRGCQNLHVPKSTPKSEVLRENGLAHSRVSRAEFLAKQPKPTFEDALVSMPMPTTSGVLLALGHMSTAKIEANKYRYRSEWAPLASDAVVLLGQLFEAGRPPTSTELRGFKQRLAALRTTGKS